MFGRKAKVNVKEFGVVVVDVSFLSHLFTAEDVLFMPNHAVKSIKVHAIFHERWGGSLILLISSPDIPGYVADSDIMEVTQYYKLQGTDYPLIEMRFDVRDEGHTDKNQIDWS